MSLRSLSRNRDLKKKFRKIQKQELSVRDLPPYERGLYYEEFVCNRLKGRGYHILDRNFRGKKRSEIDIVAKDGGTLVFIEVKARRKRSVYSPLRSIGAQKRRSLSFASKDYLQALEHSGVDIRGIEVRYDVVTVAFDKDGIPRSLDHYISYLEPNRENL